MKQYEHHNNLCALIIIVIIIKYQWKLHKITFVPLGLTARGLIRKMLNQSLTTLNLPPRLLSPVREVVLLNTCSIVRSFLSDEGHLPDDKFGISSSSNFTMFPDLCNDFKISWRNFLANTWSSDPYSGCPLNPGIAWDCPNDDDDDYYYYKIWSTYKRRRAHVKPKSRVIPVTIGATGTTSKSFIKYMIDVPTKYEIQEL